MRVFTDTSSKFGRRRLMKNGALLGGSAVATGLFASPSIVLAQGARPEITHGVQTGDISANGAMLWSRADRPSRMLVDLATTESFSNARRVIGPAALEVGDYAAKLDLTGLPAGQRIFARVRFQDLQNLDVESAPVTASFTTAPPARREVNFVWSGDTAGQGWGINLDWGGMKIYETMRQLLPDFFIHSGDTIYADGPIPAEQEMPNGGIWRNVTTEETSKVAETLAEFRGNYKYNLLDENLRRFNAEVPMLAQWDDHETVNNWYPQEILDRDDYAVKSVALLSARASQAFREFIPMREHPVEAGRVYRKVAYGPSLDVFFLDMRTYRGPNTANDQAEPGIDTVFMGTDQIRWLKQELLASNATWKVIASDMPIGLLVRDGDDFENAANGDGPVRGREFEIANLLSFIKHSNITNTVWFTADVHYTAAHYYDPNQAQFQDFEPFWEFVSGPLNAGSFGPGDLENTFGPQLLYVKSPEGVPNLPPSDGLQFFGHVRIDGDTEAMTVMLKDLTGATLYSVALEPAGAA